MRFTALTVSEAVVTADLRSQDPDAAAIPLWDSAYRPDVIGDQGNLWGDPPVPYAETAARLFAAHDAKVIMDLPCGDGRNLPPLSAGISWGTSPIRRMRSGKCTESSDRVAISWRICGR